MAKVKARDGGPAERAEEYDHFYSTAEALS
jgi:hypothetical protein